MAIDRRTFLAGLALAPLAAQASPTPAFIAARRDADGFAVAILDAQGQPLFDQRLTSRGHGAAVSPVGIAVVFARRPGRWALVLDLHRQAALGVIEPPGDRHFCGHGFFAPDGRLLYATENDFEAERGVLGVYDARTWSRLGEFDTYGIGPHEALLLRDGRTVAVANGGIATHPDYPRQKLNLPTMEPSLVYLDRATGGLVDKAAPLPDLHRLSIRHLAEAADGTVWWGGQYEGPATDVVPLIGTHRRHGEMTPIDAPAFVYRRMNQYIGAVAATDGRVATTSPRGGRVLIWEAATRRLLEDRAIADVCGVAPFGSGFLLSDGLGRLWDSSSLLSEADVAWDNHLTAL